MAEGIKNQKKHRWGWWVVLAVVVIIVLVVGIRFWNNRQNLSETLASLETEPYQRQDLNASIYGTGTVESAQTAVLTWSTGGIVGEINVALGQFVGKDDVLMALDPASVAADILQAQIDVINAQNNLDDLNTNWEADLAQAELNLLNAQEDLDDLSAERTIMNYQRCSDERIEELEEDLDDAKDIYDFIQNSTTLQAVQTAQANVDYCMADYTEREIAEAELKVELAEAKVAAYQAEVDLLTEGPDPEQMTILETQLAMAESRLSSMQIEAPFDGVITALSVQPGDVVNAGTQAVQLDDLSSLFLDVQISEVDIPQVEVGQMAELVFDAYYEETFFGEVVEISPVGTSIQGVVEYSVRIRLQDGDGQIKPGMTASVNIIFDEKTDVLVVPNNAIVTLDGQEQVFVKRNGTFVAVPVILGSYSDYYSEVLEADIEEGELLVLNPPDELTGEFPFMNRPGGGLPGFGD